MSTASLRLCEREILEKGSATSETVPQMRFTFGPLRGVQARVWLQISSAGLAVRSPSARFSYAGCAAATRLRVLTSAMRQSHVEVACGPPKCHAEGRDRELEKERLVQCLSAVEMILLLFMSETLILCIAIDVYLGI